VGKALASAHLERQRALERERTARQVAESASRAKDEFLAMLGHELRNPLAAITTAARLLELSRDGMPPSQANAAAIVSRQARHLARMTDDLLDAGRVALGKVTLSRSRMNLGRAVDAAMAALRNSRQLVQHDVSWQVEDIWIDGDATRIDQIVLNLVTNAIKYTPEGGAIRVEACRQGSEAVLRVIDTGIGLDAQLLPRVFDLFVQGERTIDRSQGGLGIGLTLVHRLAELHGGSAEVQSEGPGRGATFTVRLPAVDPQADLPGKDRHPTSTPLRIAIVEDNDDVRTGLRHLLELDGHVVREAADGQSGLSLVLGDSALDAVFIDIGLPGMDGLALARAIRAAGRRALLLVAMSGYGSERDRLRGIEAGFDAYLVKPVDPDALRSLMEKRANAVPG
jgi:CheY-like chemotaxis protein